MSKNSASSGQPHGNDYRSSFPGSYNNENRSSNDFSLIGHLFEASSGRGGSSRLPLFPVRGGRLLHDGDSTTTTSRVVYADRRTIADILDEVLELVREDKSFLRAADADAADDDDDSTMSSSSKKEEQDTDDPSRTTNN